jgi:hypothetical protein
MRWCFYWGWPISVEVFTLLYVFFIDPEAAILKQLFASADTNKARIAGAPGIGDLRGYVAGPGLPNASLTVLSSMR